MRPTPRQSALVFATLASLYGCSGGPLEFPQQLKEPGDDLEAVLAAAREQPKALFHPDAEPALLRLGSELRQSVDRATDLLRQTPAPEQTASNEAHQAARRAGQIVGLFERVFRCAEKDPQLVRPEADRVASILATEAQLIGAVPELPAGSDPLHWAQKQKQVSQLALPLVRMAATMPPSLAAHYQPGRNQFVMDPCP